jgi:hypothetical protein
VEALIVDTKEVQQEYMDEGDKEDMVVEEEYHLPTLNVVKWSMCHNFIPNHVHSIGTTIAQSMS